MPVRHEGTTAAPTDNSWNSRLISAIVGRFASLQTMNRNQVLEEAGFAVVAVRAGTVRGR
jgi:hypothetical protein